MSEHARLSPSNHRWPHCPGSVREEAAYPDISGDAAVDGTGSHLLLELALKVGVRAEVYIGEQIGVDHPEKPQGWSVCSERAERVQIALDYIHQRVTDLKELYPGCKVIVESESKSDPGGAFGRDDWWGTCDITITVLDKFGEAVFIEAADYKDGRGWVPEKENSQLESYLFGKMRNYIGSGPEKVRPFMTDRITDGGQMTVIQPKTFPPIRKERVSAEEITDRASKLATRAHATDRPDAPLIPDNKGGKGYCTWCKHKQNCTALNERELITMTQLMPVGTGGDLFQLAKEVTENLSTMDTAKLTQLADAEPGIVDIFVKAKAEIERRIEAGEDVDGWDMLPGRASRIWNDSEENIVKALKGRRLKQDEIYPRSLASPAQILKSSNLNEEQKARLERELVTTKAGANKLTRVEHKRAKEKDVTEMFGDVVEAEISFLDGPDGNEEVSFL